MNRVLTAGLEKAGVTVIPCHVRVWADAADKMAGVGGGVGIGRALRLFVAWVRLSIRFFRMPDYDVLVVGYVGHLDIFLARALSVFRRRPVVLNALISLYDTVVVDRRLVPPRSMTARLLAWIDRTAFALADRVLIDTHTHGEHLGKAYGVPAAKRIRVLVGADPTGLPESPPAAPDGGPVTVLYFGTYIALHGVPTILDAAERLSGRDDIRFVMLGRGQELEAAKTRAHGLANVRFDARWVGRSELLAAIADSHICLGVFGRGGKAGRVIPCKVFDALAMARPVITADTPAARELLTDGNDAVLVPQADGKALAAAIATLAKNAKRREALAQAGRKTFTDRCDTAPIGQALMEALSPLCDGR